MITREQLAEKEKRAPYPERIVSLHGHIIAQWYQLDRWWTCSKDTPPTYSDKDFACWPDTPANREKAYTLLGYIQDRPLIVTLLGRAPLQQRGASWFLDEKDTHAKTYIEALVALARGWDYKPRS